jgi:hypothetical protein
MGNVSAHHACLLDVDPVIARCAKRKLRKKRITFSMPKSGTSSFRPADLDRLNRIRFMLRALFPLRVCQEPEQPERGPTTICASDPACQENLIDLLHSPFEN